MAHSALWPSASSSPPGRAAQSSNVKATRDDWLELALSVLAVEGVDHVTVLSLSERLGVSRSSFYWYFKNRDELLGALLDRWDALNTRSIVDAGASARGDGQRGGLQRLPLLGQSRRSSARDSTSPCANGRAAPPTCERRSTAPTAIRTEAVKALFVRFGYEDEDALVRARVLYYMQIGYYALDLREPIETRLNLTPHYLKAFTGVDPNTGGNRRRSAPTP